MKNCSQATLAILASRQYTKIEFWQITLANGENVYLTGGQTTMLIAGNLYQKGYIFQREQIEQKAGTNVASLDLTVSPNFQLPGGPPLIAGGSFLSQCRAGVFDNAVWLLSKGFFLPPGAGPVTLGSYTYTPPALGDQWDTSPGIVPWWSGVTGEIQAGRQSADISLDEATCILANQQMPRNMIQAGCVHQFCDPGCALNKSQNTYTGAVVSVSAGNVIVTNLNPSTYPTGYFNMGIITFSSGVLSGSSYTVQSSQGSGSTNILTTIIPFPKAPSASDTFSVLVGCDKTFPTCTSGKFKLPSGSYGSNGIHYRGAPFVPQPETLYDGGTGSQTLSTIGSTGRPGSGSPFSGRVL
jgi:uncharacterized phage protein (TIGR02218 family)